MIPVGEKQLYQPLDSDIRARWGPRTRGVLIATPSNPTGSVIREEELRAIIESARNRGGFVIVDEIYQGLAYDDAVNPSALALAEDVFVVNSFSKYFNMTGWRLGWLVAPERHVRDIEKLAQNLYISPATPSQRAALACFTPETLAIVEARRSEFQARRDFLVPALRQLGFGIPVMPNGGFFVYADCSAFGLDSERFALQALEATGVAFTPGIDFGRHRPEAHVRFAYTIARPLLEEGVQRLARWLPSLCPR